MQKSKRSKTLLEVIRPEDSESTPGGFAAPAWWKSGAPPMEGERSRAEHPRSHAVSETSRGSRFPLRLAPSYLVVGIGGLAIVVFAAIKIVGMLGGEDSAADLLAANGMQSIDELRGQPAAADALDVIFGRSGDDDESERTSLASASLPSVPRANRDGESPTPDRGPYGIRQPGLNYVVVESFRGPQAERDVQLARKFLQENGIDATAERTAKGYLLITVRGFRSGDGAMDAYCREISRLGEGYFQSGGRYRFKGCYGKLLGSNGW